MPERASGHFDESITSEKAILREYLDRGQDLSTQIRMVGEPRWINPMPEAELGTFHSGSPRKLVTADAELLAEFQAAGKVPPTFLEGGPRSLLCYDPRRVRAAIVTTGGLAPGLNSIVHSIVKRHFDTYEINEGVEGAVFGVYDSFIGLKRKPMEMKALKPAETEEWLEKGGSELGNRRTRKDADIAAFARELVANLRHNMMDILYVIGGDGSQTLAHQIALSSLTLSVAGLPKRWTTTCFGYAVLRFQHGRGKGNRNHKHHELPSALNAKSLYYRALRRRVWFYRGQRRPGQRPH